MIQNYISNLGKPVYRSLTRFYSKSLKMGAQSLKSFQLIEAIKEIQVSDTENSWIRNMDLKEVEQRMQLFKNFGFSDTNCFKILKNYPTILKTPENELQEAIQQWNLCNLELNNINSILTYHPHFLFLSLVEIRKRIAYLHSVSKNKLTITKFLIANPNVMTDDWESILAKIDYLQKTKRIPVSEILKSKALSTSLDVIKLRIDILEKCGIFKVIKVMPHKVHTIKHENPHLKEITDLRDAAFAKSTAYISEEEYWVCSDLYSNSQNCDDDSDDEEDNFENSSLEYFAKISIKT